MKKWLIETLGEPALLLEADIPQPGPGQALIRIRACALNFADLLMAQGKYQDKPQLPFTPGLEWAGDVIAVGAGVHNTVLGQRVMGYTGHGGLAEYGCFDAARLVPLPDAMPYEDAAAFQIAYGTSYLALIDKAALAAGETLIVTGAAGGVGLTAIEIGKRRGARVIALARGPAKLAIAQKAGADEVLDSDHPDLVAQLRALGGADVVYETVGGALFDAVLRAMRPEGRILAIGFASGTVPQVPLNHLLVKNVAVIGFWWGAYLKFAPQRLNHATQTLLDWYNSGGLKPNISNILPLEDLPRGLELLRSRQASGKIVIRIETHTSV